MKSDSRQYATEEYNQGREAEVMYTSAVNVTTANCSRPKDEVRDELESEL